MIVSCARALLWLLLPTDTRAIIVRDLDDEYVRFISPSRTRVRATGWYCRQVVGSIVPALRMRCRRRTSSRRSVALALDGIVRDIRLALRLAVRQKSFTLAVLVTFGLGIGATTAVVSVADPVLVRPLPYKDPFELVRVWSANPRGISRNSVSPPDFFDFQEQVQPLIELAAFAPDSSSTVVILGEPSRVVGAAATANLAGLLGVRPLLGRWISPEETRTNAAVIVLSENLWHDQCGADPGIVGRTLVVDDIPTVVVGVMPRAFAFPTRDERMWTPLADSWRSQSRSAHFLGVVGRLAPGTSLDGARQLLQTVTRRLENAYPSTNRGWSVTVLSLRESVVGGVERSLFVLLAAVGCVLLISAANVAGLLLARGVARSRELALRAALGSTTARIVRAQVIEMLVLACAGGSFGIVVAIWGLRLFQSIGSGVPTLEQATLDGRVLTIAFLLTLIAGVAAGVLPTWRNTRIGVNSVAHLGTRTTTSATGLRQTIVCGQIAVATAMVIGGVLLMRSFTRLLDVDVGFERNRALVADVSLPAVRYSKDSRASFFSRSLDAIRRLPGVQAAGAGGPLPLSGQDGLLRFGLVVEGRPVVEAAPDRAYLRWATPGYFAAMRIPLKEGRAFAEADQPSSTPVAIIDEALANRFFREESPVGRRVKMSADGAWRQVIGVVGSVHQMTLERDAEPHLYVPESQMPSPSLTLVVRSAADATNLAAGVRDAVRGVDAQVALGNVRTLEDVVAGAVAVRRFSMLLLVVFAAIAVTLTAVGVYGVVAHSVEQSTRELGVRLALGANVGSVVSTVLWRSLRVAVVGVAAGLIGARFFGPVMAGLLYGVAPTDSVTQISAVALVTAATALAAYIPARRILRIDIVDVLRVE